jgi:glycosyltransferase involved in cell wall biosynthesis
VALRAAGVEVKLHDPWADDPRSYDIVHYFSCYDNVSWLRRERSVPFVVTPITWFEFRYRKRLEDRIKFEMRALRHRTRDRVRLGYPFAMPDEFYPNSEGEAHHLSRAEGVPLSKMTVVHHGVSANFADGSATIFEERFGIRDFILCVGRFEPPRKNQLTLIRAWKNDDRKLVFIGGPEPGKEAYLRACKSEAGPSTLFLEPIPHDDPLLRSAFHASRVVVLPALLESPGLTGLEGALGGATIAATERGSTKEYFGPDAFYFDPEDPVKMQAAVAAAFNAVPSERLKKRVLDAFTWDRIAKVQVAAYERLIATWAERSSPV